MAFLGFPSRGDWYRDGNSPSCTQMLKQGVRFQGPMSMPCDGYVKQGSGLQAENMLRSRLLR